MDTPDGTPNDSRTGQSNPNAQADAPLDQQSQQLPQIGISEILGLVELLKSKGGREDIYKLAAELKMEFGETLNVIRAAELLGLVNTPGGDVMVEPLGEKISRARINTRKTIVRAQIEKLPVFRKLIDFLNEKDDKQATKNEVLEKLAELLPNENVDQSFSTLVNWGRYSELFGYNDDSHTFYIDQDEEKPEK